MALKRKDADAPSDGKRKKRVGFATIDSGVDANECIKLFLVNKPEEVDAARSACIDIVGVEQFFGADGKIYGYKNLKINIWLSSVSFRASIDITSDGTRDGGKGVTDVKSALQKIFGDSLIDKNDFVESFSSETHYIRNVVSDGTVVCSDVNKELENKSENSLIVEGSIIEVVRMNLSSMPVGMLCSRLVPLVLLLVEGGSSVDITDPRWEIIFVVKKIPEQSGNFLYTLLGFTTVYHFYYYPDSTRLRISQILVLPPYQGKGYGRRLLEAVNALAICENAYDVTAEDPSDYLQHLRTCIDTSRLVHFEPTKSSVSAAVNHLKEANISKGLNNFQLNPPAHLIEAAREKLKINKKQFLRCWEVLIFLSIDFDDQKCMENFRTCVYNRVKGDVIVKGTGTNKRCLVEVPNGYGHDMTFVVFASPDCSSLDGSSGCSAEGDVKSREEQLNELVDLRMEEIAEVAKTILLHGGFK